MDIIENIKNLWDNECLDRTKDDVLIAIARDGRCACGTALSARQRYFYDKKFQEGEAEVVLDIMHNALRAQNERINEIIVNHE